MNKVEDYEYKVSKMVAALKSNQVNKALEVSETSLATVYPQG
jgi:hypothetical protein